MYGVCRRPGERARVQNFWSGGESREQGISDDGQEIAWGLEVWEFS